MTDWITIGLAVLAGAAFVFWLLDELGVPLGWATPAAKLGPWVVGLAAGVIVGRQTVGNTSSDSSSDPPQSDNPHQPDPTTAADELDQEVDQATEDEQHPSGQELRQDYEELAQ